MLLIFRLKRFLKKAYRIILKSPTQKIIYGVSDDETWGLYYGISEYTLPRLKRFKKVKTTHPAPLTAEQWDSILDKMIRSFELILDIDVVESEEISEEIEEGLDMFRKYFRYLWW